MLYIQNKNQTYKNETKHTTACQHNLKKTLNEICMKSDLISTRSCLDCKAWSNANTGGKINTKKIDGRLFNDILNDKILNELKIQQ